MPRGGLLLRASLVEGGASAATAAIDSRRLFGAGLIS